jgi:Nucleotidyl transferase of unknown function (DUF2204)
MVLDNDFKEFLQLLNRHQVKYMLIGGYAVVHYGYVRFTGDVDVWIPQSNENAQQLIKAIDDFGFDTVDLAKKDFEKEIIMFYFGTELMKIELTNRISGVDFDDCYPRRVETEIDEMIIPVIGLEDLKRNKKWSGRHKDLNDLENLP